MQEIKVRIISDYQNQIVESWLKQQSKTGDGSYTKGEYKISYTTQDIPTDFTILINKVNQDTRVSCKVIWGIQQEPFIPGNWEHIIPFKNEFAKNPKTYAQCSKVFAFTPQLFHLGGKFLPSPPYIYWLIEGEKRHISFAEIANLDITHKTKEISCIANMNKKAFAGHIQRANFVNLLKQTPLPIDYYGGEKKHNFIPTKLQALQDYKYSIAIENSSIPFYFSEKITDCFLAGCMPIYYGAKNITDFFPQESLIWIDIHNPQDAQKIIQSALKEKRWEKNQDAILESRRRVLEDYNFLQAIGEKIISHCTTTPSPSNSNIIVRGYKRGWFIHLLRNLQRLGFLLSYPLWFLKDKNENNTSNK